MNKLLAVLLLYSGSLFAQTSGYPAPSVPAGAVQADPLSSASIVFQAPASGVDANLPTPATGKTIQQYMVNGPQGPGVYVVDGLGVASKVATVTSTVAKATALAATPTGCPAGQTSNTFDASGNALNCTASSAGTPGATGPAGPTGATGATGATGPAGTGTSTCPTEQAVGIFRPECYTDSGSGNSAVYRADAAFNAASAFVTANHRGAVFQMSATLENVCNAQQGWILPHNAGGAGVSIVGVSQLGSMLTMQCNTVRTALPAGSMAGSPISQAFVWEPVPPSAQLTGYSWHDFAFSINNRASLCMDMEGSTFVSSFSKITCNGAAGDGSATSSGVRIGNASYPNISWAFQTSIDNMSITPGLGTGAGASLTVAISGGSPVITVTGGGYNYTAKTIAFLSGVNTCSVIGTLTPTITSGAITSVAASGFTCAPGQNYANVYDGGRGIQYAINLDRYTDSTVKDLQASTGSTAAILVGPLSGANHFLHAHACCGMPTGIVDSGTNTWTGTEFDGIAGFGASFQGTSASTIEGSIFVYSTAIPGSSGYTFGPYLTGVKVALGSCAQRQTAGGYVQTAGAGAAQLSLEQDCSTGLLTTNPKLVTASLPTAGLTADLHFQDGSGTTVKDSSPAGNNGTLGTGGAAPTWTTGAAQGLSFIYGNNVALPAALNGSQTFYFGVYLNPIFVNGSGQPTSGIVSYPGLLTSSLAGGSGTNLLYAYVSAGSFLSNDTFSPSIYNGGITTSIQNPIAGFHVITYVLGTGGGNLDHVYIDGVEAVGYGNQGATAGAQTSGNLFLGTSGVGVWSGQGLAGTMYRFAAYSGQHTAATVAANSGIIFADVAGRGVQIAPKSKQLAVPQLIPIADSITYGYNLANASTQAWPYNLALVNAPAYVLTNAGLINHGVQAMAGSEAWRYALSCQTAGGPSVMPIFAGTNDFSFSAVTPASVMSYLSSEIQILKNAGCRVFAGTMLSRTGNAYGGVVYDVDKDAYDALILSQARAAGADGVIDFAANPLLGADGAYANTTYFNADGVHPTAAGQLLLAAAASNSLNYYNGYKASNPRTYTATATMASGDGFVIAAPTAATTLTMPDCTGPSGETYTINNPQSAFAVSVLGGANQPINGLTTAIVIPANSTVILRDVAKPKATAGCGWAL